MTERFGLQETSRITEFQTPNHKQGYQPLDQVLDQIAPGPSNLALNSSRDGASTVFLGNLFQHITTQEKKSPNI